MIPGLEEGFDGGDEIGDTVKHAAADGLLIQVAEPSLYQIEPTGTGRYEVRDKPGMAFQPRPYLLVFVRAIVVHDQMQRDFAGKFLVQQA